MIYLYGTLVVVEFPNKGVAGTDKAALSVVNRELLQSDKLDVLELTIGPEYKLLLDVDGDALADKSVDDVVYSGLDPIAVDDDVTAVGVVDGRYGFWWR